jgi:DnaK suppressor protein
MENKKTEFELNISHSGFKKEIHQVLSDIPGEKTRFSDEELKEFKELISEKLDKSKTEYALLKETLSRKGDNGTNDTSNSFKLMENGSEASAKEETANHAVRLKKYIEHLQNALIRIENKTYGICSLTGKLISKERLRSVPHSTLSIDAKLGINVK